jgi:ATP-binding cassette subfamily B protein
MKNAKKKEFKSKTGLARCMELAKNKKGLIFLSAMFSSISAIASFVPYLAIYFIIRNILIQYPNLEELNTRAIMNYGWMAVGGIVANILLYFLAIFCSHMAAFGTLYELKIYFANHITKIPLGYHLTIGSGRMRKIMDENIESIEGFIAHQLPDFVAAITAPIAMFVVLFAVDWRFGIASFVGIILAFCVEFMGYGTDEMKTNMKNYQTSLEEMTNSSVEYVRGMPVVKAFNQTTNSFERLEKAITAYTDWVLKFSLGWQNYMPAFTTIINNIYLILIPMGIFVGSRASDYKSFAMTFIFYLLFTPAIAGILNKIMYVSEAFMQINGNVERMDEILNIPTLAEPDHPKNLVNHDVIFSDVSFSYTGNKEALALEHVSFHVEQGEFAAIVGPSGGGKSTIANLISRFWDVTEGVVMIGGVDIREISQVELMKHISFVFQDTFLFKQSILDNIRMGRPEATEEEVTAAAKAAQCHEFIIKLPRKYDTVIGTKGIHLSGGERQRIAIARAILKDAPILVLDEATAFSDSENEYLIQKAFECLMEKKTVIMIAHRLSTIMRADQILVVEEGHLVESGKHEELLHRNGQYAMMWDSYKNSLEWKITKEVVSL